ncbi:hypothetical protein [Bradyrhizobium japonicum]|uniref:hypothetical protein n=1 Tax=Bradyrhizobium japonicum TaxID=375 RepID=UPI002714E663|nr:hypothetical protein [Bradyrhizobium japonicum]WLB58164.1 hypothetical protein QIH94_19930 [Bradyrhizobium japonicum]
MINTALTRRRADNPHEETWQIYFTDVRNEAIGVRAGVPVHADQWGWSIGFYPGMEPGSRRMGIAATSKPRVRLSSPHDPSCGSPSQTPPSPNGAKTRDWRTEVAAKRARGQKLNSEIRSTLMRYVCGTTFDSWKPAESYRHRAHITAAPAAKGAHR